MNVSPITLDAIKLVARRFEALQEEEIVMVGGAVAGLLVTNKAIPQIRATEDIDVIVEITSKSAYYAFEEKLRKIGFKPLVGKGVPLCRWVVDGIVVDVMPTDPQILGFSNAWYSATIENAVPVSLETDLQIRIATAPYFLATKIEAFHGRGKGDYIASHDMEDIITVIDGRESLVKEIEQKPFELRGYLSTEFAKFMALEAFVESMPCHLLPDPASQARAAFVERQIQAIVRLGTQ